MNLLIGLLGNDKNVSIVSKMAITHFRAKQVVDLFLPAKKLIIKYIKQISIEELELKASESLLENIKLTHRILRPLIHDFCDEYNYMRDENVLNPYTVPISNWEKWTFTTKNTYKDLIIYVDKILNYVSKEARLELALKMISEKGAIIVKNMIGDEDSKYLKEKFDNFYLIGLQQIKEKVDFIDGVDEKIYCNFANQKQVLEKCEKVFKSIQNKVNEKYKK